MKIHILSNSPGDNINSGFAVVAGNLGIELSKLGHNIAFTGMQSSAIMREYKNMPVYPIVGDLSEVVYPQILINNLIRNIKIHGSEALLCLFTADQQHSILTQVHPKTYWYVPIEGEIVYRNHTIFSTARKVNQVVSMTHAAGKQLDKQGIKNTVIYHGYDPLAFRKNYDKTLEDTVAIYFPEDNNQMIIPAVALPELKEKMGIGCMITCVAQNFGIRKRLERLIEAFSIFAKDKSDVHLHLHSLPVYVKGINLLEIIDYYNIKNKITFSYSDFRSSGWSPQALNVLYRITDIYATASSGEGFGLPHLESMAAGIPQICGDFPPFQEFIGDNERGLLAKGIKQLTIAGENRYLIDTQDMAAKMETLYQNRQMRDKMGRNAEKWAQDYTWPKLAEKWNELFLQG